MFVWNIKKNVALIIIWVKTQESIFMHNNTFQNSFYGLIPQKMLFKVKHSVVNGLILQNISQPVYLI